MATSRNVIRDTRIGGSVRATIDGVDHAKDENGEINALFGSHVTGDVHFEISNRREGSAVREPIVAVWKTLPGVNACLQITKVLTAFVMRLAGH